MTHRIQNAGDRLFRFMVVSNASPGDESAASPADDIGFYKGLETKPMDEWTVFRLTGESLRKLADGG